MLMFLDVMYTIVHIIIIIFNLTGWIFSRTRKWHLVLIAITCFCWLVAGIWYGFGYCPVTDWQWSVKTKLGESNLPDSFITYLVNNLLGAHVPEPFILNATALSFLLVVLITIYVNFFSQRFRKKATS
ncbi:DUF2784 domain-containing protein [Flavitalea antarctica]